MSTGKLNQMKSEAQEAENRGSYFEASFLYTNLLKEAKIDNNGDIISESKQKIVEMNNLSKSEFKEITIERNIPNEIIDKDIDHIIGDSDLLEEILYRIGHHPYLYPKKKKIEESSKKNISIFRSLASNHIISEDNHALGGNDQAYIEYLEDYSISQDMIIQIYLNRVFDKLVQKNGLDFNKLFEYIKYKNIFREDDLTFIESGFASFFKSDYCSAIHVLIPRFEKCFVNLSKALGINTVSLKRPKKGTDDIITSDITLSVEILRSEEFIKAWGEDFCENVIFVFYERLGYGLRHKVAHGSISMLECNKSVCQLVIYFYIVLASRIRLNNDNA